MNQTVHLLKKDARHLRWALLVWTVIVAAHVALDINRASIELHGPAAAIGAGQMASLISFIELVMTGLIVSLLVHEDPLVGREAFWLTRPLEPRRVAAAKLVLALAALILLPLAGDLVTIGTFHAGARNILRAVPPIVLGRLASVLPLMVAAALTASLARYVLLIVGAMGAFVLFVAVMMAGALLFMKINDEASAAPPLVDPVPSTVMTMLVIAVSLWVIVYQYRRRQLKRAVIMTVAGLGVAVLVPMIWPFPAPVTAFDPGPWAHDVRTAAAVEPDPPAVSDEIAFNQRESTTKQIAAHVRLAGMPENFSVRTVRSRSRFEVAGATIVSTPYRLVSVRHAATAGPASDSLRPLQAALGNVRFVGGSGEEDYDMWPVLLLLTDQEFSQYGRTPGRLTAAMDFQVLRSTVADEGPLQAGWRFQEDARRTEVTRINRRPDGCTVVLRDVVIEPLFTRHEPGEEEFVLRNSTRGEAVRGSQEWFAADNSSPIPFLLHATIGAFGGGSSSGRGYSVRNYAVRYPARHSPPLADPVIDAEWLESATLVRVRKSYAGQVARSVTIENFRMVQ